MKKLISFFKSKNYWVQNAFAVDKDGNPINLNINTEHEETRIYAMSLHGAIAYLFSFEREGDRRIQVMNRISKAIAIYKKKNMYIAEFNNSEQTSFEDIQAVLKIANEIR